MAKLKKAGLVQTKEGNEGGYRFDKKPQEVTLYQVANALEFRFVSAAWRSGNPDMECLIASGMADVMDGIFTDLNEQCKQQLKNITIAQIDHKIFGGKQS